MDPSDVLPSTIWEQVFLNMDGPELLPLWKTNHYFKDRLTARICYLKKKFYGIELIRSEEQRTSSLTTYYLMSEVNNILLPGMYRLTSDIVCDTTFDESVFIVSGKIQFITNSFKFIFARGVFFEASNCIIHDTNFIFGYVGTPYVKFTRDEFPEDPRCSVFIHCISNTTITECHFMLNCPATFGSHIRVEQMANGNLLLNST